MGTLDPLLATVVWPLAAVLLVACGATFATSGRSSAAVSERSGGRSDLLAPNGLAPNGLAPNGSADRASGAADARQGNHLMVVIAPDDGGRTVMSAIEAARRSGAEITLVGDAATVARTYDRVGSMDGRPSAGRTFGLG